jgi:hypothetical protein
VEAVEPQLIPNLPPEKVAWRPRLPISSFYQGQERDPSLIIQRLSLPGQSQLIHLKAVLLRYRIALVVVFRDEAQC